MWTLINLLLLFVTVAFFYLANRPDGNHGWDSVLYFFIGLFFMVITAMSAGVHLIFWMST